jgi:hypothetical protein
MGWLVRVFKDGNKFAKTIRCDGWMASEKYEVFHPIQHAWIFSKTTEPLSCAPADLGEVVA